MTEEQAGDSRDRDPTTQDAGPGSAAGEDLPARTLYVLRHAKSDWSDPSLPDRERPLADRGRRQVGRLVRYAPSLAVDEVVSSPAVRARLTVDPVREVIGCPLRQDSRLYSGATDELVEVVRELTDDVRSAMVVGHMPSLASLVERLTGEFLDFPTGGLATVALPGSWSAAGETPGRVVELIAPRDLRRMQEPPPESAPAGKAAKPGKAPKTGKESKSGKAGKASKGGKAGKDGKSGKSGKAGKGK